MSENLENRSYALRGNAVCDALHHGKQSTLPEQNKLETTKYETIKKISANH